ncbi:MAG: ribonuclease domain-containing protein [Gallionella sp.]|nr:ribonuclease domain-containing protein [Gallionella sp.]
MLRLLWIVFAALLWLPLTSQGSQPAQDRPENLSVIAVANLPAKARDTLRIIKQGGPFAYSRDGTAFKNYEHILPAQPRDYYREYTVKTPGARNRGTRRIISGKLNEYYYTADHYQTFKRILE